jgi:hypothetical protein
MGKSSAASAANAACDHVHDWWYGTKPGKFVSMGVISNGNSYGAPEGVVYSFPLSIDHNGKWTIVDGLTKTRWSRLEPNWSMNAKWPSVFENKALYIVSNLVSIFDKTLIILTVLFISHLFTPIFSLLMLWCIFYRFIVLNNIAISGQWFCSNFWLGNFSFF